MAIELTAQQAAAVTDRGGNLLVSAAAGSGKTRVLVERLMDHVRKGADIDHFLIITFTNAAAAELRDRIARAIHDLLAQDPANRHLRRNATLVYKAPISTIDAFCLDFLRECATAAGLEPDFRVCDEAESRALGQQAMETVLERRYQTIEDDSGFQALVDALAGDRDDQTIEEVVFDIHRRVQSHPDPLRWLEERRADFVFSPDAMPEHTPWGRLLLDDGRALADYWAGALEALGEELAFDPVMEANYGPSLSATAAHLRALSQAMGQGWDQAAALFPVPFPRVGAKKGADPALKERAKVLRDLCKKQVTRLGERFSVSAAGAMDDLRSVAPAMVTLLEVTAEYDRELTALKRRRHLIDFADGEHLTARLLTREDGQPSALAAEWSRRYVEIMVDEYQDTNAVQNVIFDALSTGDNLFMVGDVKQSIYRFRLADPTIFLDKYARYADYRVAEEGEGRTVLLSANFRSRPEVLEGVNFLFCNVMTQAVGEMDYTPDEALVPGRADLPPDGRYCVELDCVDLTGLTDGEDGRADKDLVEARAVAARIAALLSEGLPIGERSVTPEDIVILLRSPGPVLWAYTQALNEAGIPWQAEEGGEFFGTTEISVALSLLQVIDNPRQDVPLLAVLRSPLYDFSPDRLAQLRAGEEGMVYDCLTAAAARGETDCVQFLDTLSELRTLAAEESSHRLLWEVYRRTDLLAVFSTMPDGERRRANLLALYDAARRFESAGHKGLFGFLAHVGRMMENGLTLPVPSASGGGVRILSIHKSKGLEFPVVFLCGLERQFNEGDSKATILFHDKLGLGPKRTDRARMVRYTTIARDAVALRLRQQLRAEELRLLYVAMTRAEHKLFLFTAVNGRGDSLNTLALQAQCPPPPQLMAQARSMVPWVLIPALCRPDSAPLWENLDCDRPAPPAELGPRWDMRLVPGEDYETPLARFAPLAGENGEDAPEPGPGAEKLAARFGWTYPHQASVDMPSKLTATQLKGREKDTEVSEEAEALSPQRTVRTLRRPIFEKERPLTPTERGTALHLAMQYLDYARTDTEEDIREEVARLVSGQFITPAQGAAVDTAAIRALFASPLGRKLRTAPQVEREFKFSMLVDAADYDPAGEPGEKVLLQGVVDCWFREEDGTVTVVDFKTDWVTDETVTARAAEYRPQLEAYTRALGEGMGAAVGRRTLWFFAVGREISW